MKIGRLSSKMDSFNPLPPQYNVHILKVEFLIRDVFLHSRCKMENDVKLKDCLGLQSINESSLSEKRSSSGNKTH